MNDTERFDERVRAEMDNLDTPPEHFRQGAVWQQLQAQLHPTPARKPVFARLKALRAPVAAAVIVLLMTAGGWWYQSGKSVNADRASNVVNVPNFDQVEKPLPPVAVKAPARRLTAPEKAQESATVDKNRLTEVPKPIDTSPNFDKVETPSIEVSTEIADIIPAAVSEVTAPTPIAPEKTAVKPRFKMVHANELDDYQKAEIAESIEKEAKANGFVIINWKANAAQSSQSSLMTYLKNKGEVNSQ